MSSTGEPASGRGPPLDDISNIIDQAAAGNISRDLAISEIKANLQKSFAEGELEHNQREEGPSIAELANENDGGNDDNNNFVDNQLDSNNGVLDREQRRQKLFQKKNFGEQVNEMAEDSVSTVMGSDRVEMMTDGNESWLQSQDREEEYFNSNSLSKDDAFRKQDYSSDGRNGRVHQYENHVREDMYREYTFKPQIRSLPKSIYPESKSQEMSFIERVTKWQNEKQSEAQKRSDAYKQGEVIACTWRPKIDPMSSKYAQAARDEFEGLEVGDRLYKYAEKMASNKNEIIEMKSRQAFEKFQSECTFQPNMKLTKKANTEVVAKHMKPLPIAWNVKKDTGLTAEEKKKYTFTPDIKPIPKSMKSANAYLATKVTERLSRCSSPDLSVKSKGRKDDSSSVNGGVSSELSLFSDKEAVDSSAFLRGRGVNRPRTADRTNSPIRSIRSNSAGRESNEFRTPGTPGFKTPTSSRQNNNRIRSHSAPRERSRSYDSDAFSKFSMEERFEHFIQRQRLSVAAKEKQLKLLEKQLTPSFKPKIGSYFLDNTETSGIFLDRMEADNIKRTERKEREKHIKEEKIKQQLTSTPGITPWAERRNIPAKYNRDFSEVQQKREENIRKLAAQIDMREGISNFKPSISSLGKSKVSNLASDIKNGSSKFLEAYKERQFQRSMDQINERLRRDEEELQKCTFVPKHTELPEYIKRMSESVKLMREFKQIESKESKAKMQPRWK